MVVDESDIYSGSGQWKNIQHIVRSAFQKCFEQIKSQAQEIEALKQSMKSQLNERFCANLIFLII